MMERIEALRRLVPELELRTDSLDLLRTDIFYVAEYAPLALAVPRSVGQVQALVQGARTLGLSLATRGAGLSYSAGYLPSDPRTVMVDMTAMDRVLEINPEDRFVTVEPGVTWAALHQALRPLGLRTPFWGTFSGRHATVGATLAQGAKFYGSGHRGTSAESVLGLAVVTGTGEVLVTGSAAAASAAEAGAASPFFRNYGPDLTGPFLGDSGAFGIKVAATLMLIPRPGAVAVASYSFEDPAALLQTMGRIGAEMLASECLAMDPFTARARMASQGLRADLAALRSVLQGGGVLDAVQIAVSGRRFAKRIGYLMNCTAEGRDRADAQSRIRRVRAIAAEAGGRRVPASVPKVMQAMPFPPMNGLLTPSGKRMNWLHVVVPSSRVVACFEATEAVFAAHQDAMRAHGIDRGYLLSAHGPTGVGIETLIRWSDAPLPIHTHFMTEAERKRLRVRADNPAARQAVVALSQAMVARWAEFGGVHMQIGRKYPYLSTRLPATQALLRTLKAALDPDGVINPGNLFSS